jgi:hypothetical protein
LIHAAEGPYETSNLLTTVAAATLLVADSFTVCFKIPSFSNSLKSTNVSEIPVTVSDEL